MYGRIRTTVRHPLHGQTLLLNLDRSKYASANPSIFQTDFNYEGATQVLGVTRSQYCFFLLGTHALMDRNRLVVVSKLDLEWAIAERTRTDHVAAHEISKAVKRSLIDVVASS